MAYIDDFKVNNQIYDIELKRLVRGNGEPTVKTQGEVGYLYIDQDNGTLYQLVKVEVDLFTWARFTTNAELSTVNDVISSNKASAEAQAQTIQQNLTALQESVESRLATLESVPRLKFEYLDNFEALPEVGAADVIYLLKSGEEYVYKDGKYELFGTIVDTDVDLTNYYTITQTENAIDTKIHALKEELELTFNYAVPTIDFDIFPKEKDVEITSSNGATYLLTGIYHKENNAQNIKGNLTLYQDGVKLKDNISPSADGITISDGISFQTNHNTAKVVTYSLEGFDKKDTKISATKQVRFYFAGYIGGNKASLVTSQLFNELTKVKDLSGNVEVVLNENGYVWFMTPTQITKITANGFDVPFKWVEDYFHNGCYYKCYRTTSLILAGQYTYNIRG